MIQRRETEELKALAQDNLRTILDQLAPGGRFQGGSKPSYLVSNPMRNDRNPSLCIWTRGTAAGGFVDWAERDVIKGDIFGLVAYLNGKPIKDFGFAAGWLRDMLGIEHMTAEDRRAAKEARDQRRRENAEAEERKRRHGAQRAYDKWRYGRMVMPGSTAYRYLEARGVPLAEVQHYSGELRYLPAEEYWMAAEWGERTESGRIQRYKVRPGPKFPCIITPLRDAKGTLRSLHYTFLAPDGSGKADVEKPKLIWPEQLGLSMWIGHGPTGLDPCQADATDGVTGPLCLTEGLEDGLSAALAVPELRVWGAISLGNLAHQPVDRPCVSEIYVAAQNDWGKAEALAHLQRAETALARAGKPMTRLPAFTGKDLNDTLTGKD
ncbi:toprim domain-containing protein [Ancylobacter dichloromethanicus]|uniref:Toprim domain-containing protein n=2 Tax=Ancylobacter dichloromethanicus TaxID=518825 RepID=A0A9W6J832_9HYPH|nr:toprim domain-containing protein [Ancylobacter dichloromethanicus]MBS7553526.1 toprim domain-containing protein [Ancylobacter dichloromethanicus]GLK72585.1 hypothetical protein GCM10017643_27010 [Ancylobacter dichloromethanicus]